MTFRTERQSSHWVIGLTVIALVSSYFFFQDIINPDWPAWVISPALVMGFYAGVAFTSAHGIARAVLYHAAVLLVPFMGLYSIIEELFLADWPELVVLPVAILFVWLGVGLAADEDDN